jgi:glycine cleavage system T protein (aminomethyltransferase)
MNVPREVAAIRSSVALSRGSHVSAVRVAGPGAFEAVDSISPRELYIQDGQALHTLFLDDGGHAVADVYVCADGEDFLLLGEAREQSLLDYVRDRARQRGGTEIEDLAASHEVLSLHGPYAWELLAEVLTPEIIGLPYLGFFREGQLTCLRAGKTGEYGYDLLVARDEADAFVERIVERGAAFDLATATLEALDTCALESWFFNVRREGGADVTPVELQLQWRVSYERTYPGVSALLERRAAPTKRRIVLVAAGAPLAERDRVLCEGDAIGELLAATRSPTLENWLGIALLDASLAYPGIEGFTVARGSSAIPLRSLSAPPINNRSLYVDPQRHSYLTRDRDLFPPLGPLS